MPDEGLGSGLAAQAPANDQPRRGDMFIAHDIHKTCSKPRRGGTGLLHAEHVAPPGLGWILGMDACYKHGAPTELGLGTVRVQACGLARRPVFSLPAWMQRKR